jgi:hypothetical protein
MVKKYVRKISKYTLLPSLVKHVFLIIFNLKCVSMHGLVNATLNELNILIFQIPI